MRPVYLLTALREQGHNFKPADTAGEWVKISGTLGELGGALNIDENANVDVVRSTPDPWAQARSFADAMLAHSPRDSRIIAQWRGLLALFALKERLKDVYQIRAQPIALADRTSRFAEVMRRLLPHSTLAAASDGVSHGWDRPVLIRLFELDSDGRERGDGHPIGLLNPASLIAAGRDVERFHVQQIPWMRDGLADPTALTDGASLPPSQLHLIADFLLDLDEGVAKLCVDRGDAHQQALLAGIREQLQAYRKDCLGTRGENGSQFATQPGEEWGKELPALYRLLTQPKSLKQPPAGTSDCIVGLRRDLGSNPPFRGLILLDSSLAAADRSANQITFWGLSTLADVISGGTLQREKLRKEIADAGYLMVEPDDFLTDLFVRLDDAEQPGRIAAHPQALADSLLPLSPLALLIATPNDLKKQLNVTRDGTVQLRLTLPGGSHLLERRYASDPKLGEGRLLDKVDWGLGDFAVWPDFASPQWTHYCAKFDYSPNNLRRLRGRFALSGALFAALLGDETPHARIAAWLDGAPFDGQGGNEALDRVPDFAGRGSTSPDLTRLRASNAEGNASEVQVARLPFEAAFFTVLTDASPAAVPAGMALLSLNSAETDHEERGHVGIDFGTTNTVACLNSASPVKLKPRIIHPITFPREWSARGTAGDVKLKFRDFLPADERALPTPTVVRSRPLDPPAQALLDADKRSTARPFDNGLLLRHLIYFQPDFAADGSVGVVPIKEWTSLLRTLRFDLKWSRDDTELQDAARRYLRQLMLMISAEWAAGGGDPLNLSWHFSRPEHMGRNVEFRRGLQEALLEILPGADREAIGTLQKEGLAAATYILNPDAQSQRTRGTINVVLDIGGGTTDIAVWDSGQTPTLLWSDSLRLAGGDFFTNHVIGNPELLEDFGLGSWTTILAKLSNETDANVKANVRFVGELLFSGDALGDAIDKQWNRVSGTKHVERLKETAFVFLGGVAWYIGRQLRNKLRDGTIREIALQDIVVALCGRGSGLFARLHGSSPAARTEVSQLLLLIAVAAGESRPTVPKVQVSPFPKIEVAAGLVMRARQADGTRTDEAGVAGDERIDFGDDNSATDQVKADARGDEYVTFPLQIGLEDFGPFLRALEKAVGLKVTLDDEQRAKLVNGFSAIDGEDMAGDRPPQSEFAVALKILVELIRARADNPIRPKTSWTN